MSSDPTPTDPIERAARSAVLADATYLDCVRAGVDGNGLAVAAVRAVSAAGLLAAAPSMSAADQIEDMIARLVAADIGWCHQFGDVPAQPAYIKSLATQMCAFDPPLSSPAPADDEAAQVERMARAIAVSSGVRFHSDGAWWNATVAQAHRRMATAALAALREGQR